MMAGPRVRQPQDTLPYRVLVTTDGSPAAELVLPALRRVFEAAPSEDVELALLRVHETVSDDRPLAVALKESQIELAAFRRRAPRRFPIDSELREASRRGRVAQEILASAGSREVDAIWMSTHGASLSRQVLLGSIALAMVGRSPVPVVLTRALD
jgi:nucleotide-binding universal stress UspA family protein